MTLEDAIVYYGETAKECRMKARIESNDYMDMKDRAYEAEQLADWLNELKVLRERIDAQPEIIHCQDCKYSSANRKYGCGLHSRNDDEIVPMFANDYCSYAVRREE